MARRGTHLLQTQTKERLDRIEVELESGADHGLVEVRVDESVAALVGAVRVKDPALLEHQTLTMSETTESVLAIDGRHEQPATIRSSDRWHSAPDSTPGHAEDAHRLVEPL